MALTDALTSGFCATAASRTATLRQTIADHPFNRALADGSLDEERFGFYLVQDARYLAGFSRALAAAATRAPDTDSAGFFAQAASGALEEERQLHEGELARLGWDRARTEGVNTSPSALAYTSYLAAVGAVEPWPVLVAALLPCFWVYEEVGLDIAAHTPDLASHPYRAWIAAYSDPAFGEAVSRIRTIADSTAATATPVMAEHMLAAFTRATEYEWMFWDSAWRLEGWPTAAWLVVDVSP